MEAVMDRVEMFPIGIHSGRVDIFQPKYEMDVSKTSILLGPAKTVMSDLTERFEWLDTVTREDETANASQSSSKERSQVAYLEMMKGFVSGTSYGKAERSVVPRLNEARAELGPFDPELRNGGLDWTYLGDTMTGSLRLDNVQNLLERVIANDVEGDYIETGVWRGGSSMFARAILYAHDQENRKSYVCDSFAGLPPGDRYLVKGDRGWDHTPYLEVPAEIVAQGFAKYSLLDSNVIFAKGFFNETMPVLAKQIDQISIMRLDGDMYESTVDVLYNLYDKLSIGGFVIMDDWYNFPSKIAVEDFFAMHSVDMPQIVQIDDLSAYWQKTNTLKVQYWRYTQNKMVVSREDTPPPSFDAAGPSPDAVVPPPDTGSPPPVGPPDAASPPPDALPSADAATLPDTGSPPSDAVVPPPDAVVPPPS